MQDASRGSSSSASTRRSGRTQRYAEYTAWDWMLGGEPVVAEGAATADFLVEQVIPHVQATYRVARDRAPVGLAGSSMGGYMTLFTGVRHPEVFGRLLAFSPILLDEPMAGHELRDCIVHRGFDRATWVYLDMGDAEELSYIDHPDRVVENLAETTAAVARSARPARAVGEPGHSRGAPRRTRLGRAVRRRPPLGLRRRAGPDLVRVRSAHAA